MNANYDQTIEKMYHPENFDPQEKEDCETIPDIFDQMDNED